MHFFLNKSIHLLFNLSTVVYVPYEYLLHLEFFLSSNKRWRITFLLKVHSHELINGQSTGGSLLKLCQPGHQCRRNVWGNVTVQASGVHNLSFNLGCTSIKILGDTNKSLTTVYYIIPQDCYLLVF